MQEVAVLDCFTWNTVNIGINLGVYWKQLDRRSLGLVENSLALGEIKNCNLWVEYPRLFCAVCFQYFPSR